MALHHTPTDPLPTRILHESDAARYIGLSRAYLRAARVGRCDGPVYIKIGRAVRYHVEDLDAWLRSLRVVDRRGQQVTIQLLQI